MHIVHACDSGNRSIFQLFFPLASLYLVCSETRGFIRLVVVSLIFLTKQNVSLFIRNPKKTLAKRVSNTIYDTLSKVFKSLWKT